MGASQSSARSESDEHVFPSESPISLSPDVVKDLSDRAGANETSPERQTLLDAQIRKRIQSEIDILKQQEDQVRREIELALEKENLDREKGVSEDGSEDAERIPSSIKLMNDLEDVRSKVDRYHSRRDLSDFPEVKSAGEAVVSCYRAKPQTPLDCWREVAQFKDSVALVEQQHFKALQ